MTTVEDETLESEEEVKEEQSNVNEDDELMAIIGHRSVVEMLNEGKNREYREMLVSSVEFLNGRKFLNYNKTISELSKVSIHSVNLDDYREEDSNIGMYARIINDIDNSRSRISNIMAYAQADLYWVEKTYETLFKVWVGKFSKMTSDKKREGEADQVLFFLLSERIKRKELIDTAKNKFNLMNAKMDAISRKITIASELMKHHPGLGNVYDTDSATNAIIKKDTHVKKKDYADRGKNSNKTGWDAFVD